MEDDICIQYKSFSGSSGHGLYDTDISWRSWFRAGNAVLPDQPVVPTKYKMNINIKMPLVLR